MSKIRTILAACAVALLAMLAAAVAAAPASAAQGYAGRAPVANLDGSITVYPVAVQAATACPWGHLCIYPLPDQSVGTSGHMYVFDAWYFSPGQCYTLGTDPLGFNWNDHVDSVWFNDYNYIAANFYKHGCTNTFVTTAKANLVPADAKQSCNEPYASWRGPCGASGVSAFTIVNW